MQLTSRSISLDICQIDSNTGRIELYISVIDGREMYGEPAWVKRQEFVSFCKGFESLYTGGDQAHASLSSDSIGTFQIQITTPRNTGRYSAIDLQLATKRYPTALLDRQVPHDFKLTWNIHHNALVELARNALVNLLKLDALAARIEESLESLGCCEHNAAAFSRTGLPIPPHLLALDFAGRWKLPADRTQPSVIRRATVCSILSSP